MALVLPTAGCAPGPAPEPGPSTTAPASRSDAQAVLDQLAEAARRGDRPGFDRLTSTRDPAFADRARQLYTNLRELRLEQLELRLQPGERALPPARRDLLGPEAWRQPALVRWRLAGETAAAEHTVWLTFTVQDGRPLLAGTIDRSADAPAPVPLWWTAPVHVARQGRATVLLGPGQPAQVWSDRVATAVTEVRRRVSAGRAARWSGAAVVEVPATRGDFEAVLGATDGSYAAIAAVTLAEGSAATAAARVVVNPEVTRTLAPLGVAVVLLHEMVHVATRSTDSPAPTWIVEGLADQIALQVYPAAGAGAAEPLLERVRSEGAPTSFPRDERFRAGEPDLDVSYAAAWLACRYIAETYSPAALQRLYTALDAGTGLDAAVQDELGVSSAALTAGWRRYLERRAGG